MARRQTGGRGRAAAFLVVSLIAAVSATAVIYNLFQGFQEELAKAQEKEEMVRVVAAGSELFQGASIKAEQLKYVELPPAFVPDGTFLDIEEAVDRVPLERVLGDELLRIERLATVDAGVGLNAIIPRGMRAVSVNIEDASSVSGFLNPGNYVDILVTIQSSSKVYTTTTLLQAVKVLAVDNRLGGRATEIDMRNYKPSVTVAITPQDGELLAHSAAQGKLTLTLRNDVDVEKKEFDGAATIAKLIGREQIVVKDVKPSKQALRKAKPKIRKVKEVAKPTGPVIIRGRNVTGG